MLKKYNPGIEIYGLYGFADRRIYLEAKRSLRDEIIGIYYNKKKTKEWYKRNFDLATRDWFMNFGKEIDFDVLHIIEWDMLLFDSIEKLYSKVPESGVGLTGLRPIKEVEAIWDRTAEEPDRSLWKGFLSLVRKKYNYKGEPYGCIGPGTTLPREFLEEYSRVNPPETVHDELRVPVFAQILGFKLYDTGFYPKWCDKKVQETFNALPVEIKLSVIKRELLKKNGKRIFHPYYRVWR